MQIIYERCCACDVHKKTVVACVMCSQEGGSVFKQVRTFPTTTAGLLALSDWLEHLQITVVAMESTAEYTPPTMLPIVGGIV